MTNSLLIRAKPIDLLTIRRLLAYQLDVGSVDTQVTRKNFIIGPLKNANAQEIAEILERVYRDSIAKNTSISQQSGPGFQSFQASRTAEPVSGAGVLNVGVEIKTNSIIVNCSTTMYEGVKKLAEDLDKAAGDTKQVVRVVSVKDIDPLIVQQLVDAMSGKTTAANQQRPNNQFGNNQGNQGRGNFGGGNFGGGNFGGGNFGGGNFGGGGAPTIIAPFGGGGGFNPGGFNPGGFNPGGVNPGGGGGGGGPKGGGGGGGPKGGGKTGRSLERGPDFFVSRVMDDPSVLFDPAEEQDDYPRPSNGYLNLPPYMANAADLAALLQEKIPPPKDMVAPAPKTKMISRPPGSPFRSNRFLRWASSSSAPKTWPTLRPCYAS